MKKITMLFIAVFVFMMSLAQVQHPNNKTTRTHLGTNVTQKQDKYSAIKFLGLSANIGKATVNGYAAKSAVRKAGGSETIKTPKGTPKIFALTTTESDENNHKKDISEYSDTVYFDGTDAYFKDMVLAVKDGSYIKGTITSGDEHNGTITVDNGQYCADGYHAYMGKKNGSGKLIADKKTANFTFTIKNDTIFSDPVQATTVLCLLAVNKSGDVGGYNSNYEFIPVDASALIPTVLPEGIETELYKVASNRHNKLLSDKRVMAKIGKMNNDLYLTDLPSAPNAVIKGTLNSDGKIEVKLPFYLGTVNNRYSYLYAATIEGGINDDGDSIVVPKILNQDKLVCDYDATTGKINSNQFLVIMSGSSLVGCLNTPSFEPFNDKPVVIPSTAVNSVYSITENGSSRMRKSVIGRDGDDFYFRGIVNSDPDVAFKGTLKGDSIYVNMPQYLCIDENDYDFLYRVTTEPDPSGYDKYVVNFDANPMRFYYDKNSGTISSDEMFGSATFEGKINLLGGNTVLLEKPVWKLFSETPATVPTDATIEQYALSKSALDGSPTLVQTVRIAHKDNTYYFMDVDPEDTTALFVGTRDGNKITIDVPQYVGGMDFNYLKAGHKPYKSDDFGETFWNFDVSNDKQLILNYDEEKDVFSSDSVFAFVSINGNISNYYYKPVYNKYTPHSTTPASPIPQSWSDFSAYGAGYLFQVDIPNTDTNGEFIDTNNMIYNIYFDDSTSPYVFTAVKYDNDFAEDTQDVPYNQSTNSFITDGISHIITFVESPQKRVGISSSYIFDGTKNSSAIVYYYFNPADGINNVNATNVINTVYYDMSGRRVVNPTHGLFIHKVTFADGTSRTYKEMMK